MFEDSSSIVCLATVIVRIGCDEDIHSMSSPIPAGFKPIQPVKGLKALEAVLKNSSSQVLQGVGTFVWPVLMRQKARHCSGLFAEFAGSSESPKVQPQRQIDAVTTPTRGAMPRDEVQREILRILEGVLGKLPEISQPLMEVGLAFTVVRSLMQLDLSFVVLRSRADL